MKVPKVKSSAVKKIRQLTFKFPKKKPEQVQLTFKFPKVDKAQVPNKLDKLA